MISGLFMQMLLSSAPVAGQRLTVRKAGDARHPADSRLINGYAAKGIMLPRTEFEMSEAIRDFIVVMQGGEFLGCGALHFYSPTVGEIRSLAVHEQAKTKGVGRILVESLVAEARDVRVGCRICLHLCREFFNRVGFHAVERGVLPLKAWKDCLRCSKFSGMR